MFCQTASSACSFSRGVLCCPQERHGMLPWERHECCLSVRKIPSFSISEGAGLPDAEKAVFYHVIIRARLQIICPPSPWKAKCQIFSHSLPQPSGISDALKYQWSKSRCFIFCREWNTAKPTGHCPSRLIPCVVSNTSQRCCLGMSRCPLCLSPFKYGSFT